MTTPVARPVRLPVVTERWGLFAVVPAGRARTLAQQIAAERALADRLRASLRRQGRRPLDDPTLTWVGVRAVPAPTEADPTRMGLRRCRGSEAAEQWELHATVLTIPCPAGALARAV